MAHIEVDKRELDELTGETVTEQTLREKASFLGVHWNHVEGPKWDVEVYPDRPDLLSVEGLARAYRGFLDIENGFDQYDVEKGDIDIDVDDSVSDVRPFIGGAVVKDLELSEKIINGLIQLQEKLHETMGRRRDKLAIGLHDLEAVEPPFTYRAVKPETVEFVPLEHEKQMQLGEILEEHDKGRKYSWILEDEDRYPVIVDSEDTVLSFPPIINNQLTEVDSGTTDIFVDVTGKDEETVHRALNILVTALAERDGAIESVWVDGKELPDLYPEEMELDTDYVRKVSGIGITDDEIVDRLERMKFGTAQENGLKVKVPGYRTDVMHQYDLIEDVVIAHGYDNITPELPEVDQIAEQEPVERFSDDVRDVMVRSGALEANTHALSSKEKLFERMEKEYGEVAEMANALTEDYSVVRSWLLPGMLQVLKDNKHNSYPQRFFEATDVSLLDDSDTGASNRKKLSYVVSDSSIDFTDARKTLQVLGRDLDLEFEVKSGQKPFFKGNRSGDIFLEGEKIGFIGEISGEVEENWELENSVAGFEIDLEKVYSLK